MVIYQYNKDVNIYIIHIFPDHDFDVPDEICVP